MFLVVMAHMCGPYLTTSLEPFPGLFGISSLDLCGGAKSEHGSKVGVHSNEDMNLVETSKKFLTALVGSVEVL